MSTKKNEGKMIYIHTLDGQPAYWSERDKQIVIADDLAAWNDEAEACLARATIEEIEDDRKKSTASRRKWGFDLPKYGYVAVSLTPQPIPAPDEESR